MPGLGGCEGWGGWQGCPCVTPPWARLHQGSWPSYVGAQGFRHRCSREQAASSLLFCLRSHAVSPPLPPSREVSLRPAWIQGRGWRPTFQWGEHQGPIEESTQGGRGCAILKMQFVVPAMGTLMQRWGTRGSGEPMVQRLPCLHASKEE